MNLPLYFFSLDPHNNILIINLGIWRRIVNKRIEIPRVKKEGHYMAKSALQEKKRKEKNQSFFGHEIEAAKLVQPIMSTKHITSEAHPKLKHIG